MTCETAPESDGRQARITGLNDAARRGRRLTAWPLLPGEMRRAHDDEEVLLRDAADQLLAGQRAHDRRDASHNEGVRGAGVHLPPHVDQLAASCQSPIELGEELVHRVLIFTLRSVFV